MKAVVKKFCARCQRWRTPIEGSQIGDRCPVCGSGRMRPPFPGEKIPDPPKVPVEIE